MVRARLKELAGKYSKYGSPMLHVILRREGFVKNHKRTERIYREEGLSLRLKQKKRRIASLRVVQLPATERNEKWSMDFVSDGFYNGRRFRCLTVIDNFTKESPVIEVDTSISGVRVTRILDRLAATHGLPKSITVDNGPEFISRALSIWAYAHNVKIDFIRPGKPTDSPYIESFNGKFRNECLNQHWFMNLEDARQKIEEWRNIYNTERPHSSLNNLTPNEFAKQCEVMLTG